MKLQNEVGILKNGGIGIFPTDTAFGIGCRIDSENSIKRLFDIRHRAHDKAVPVLVSTVQMAQEYLEPIPDSVQNLMRQYWPGGLTIVFPCRKEKIPELARGGGDTIGVRIPDNEICLKLINEVGVPLLGPSANFAGGKTPYEFEDIDPTLPKLVDFVLPGECRLKQASTVIDCSVSPWRILREGAVTLDISSKL